MHWARFSGRQRRQAAQSLAIDQPIDAADEAGTADDVAERRGDEIVNDRAEGQQLAVEKGLYGFREIPAARAA